MKVLASFQGARGTCCHGGDAGLAAEIVPADGITAKALRSGATALKAGFAAAVLLALLAPGVGAGTRAINPAAQASTIVDRYIVAYEHSVAKPDAEIDRQERAWGFRARLRYRHALKGFAAKLSAAQVARLRSDPDVESVTPDRRVTVSAAVPLASGEEPPPSGVRRIQAASSTATREPSDVGVAVIDTGVDLAHPDLNAVDGTNCVSPGASAQDDNGHGTHVAGTIAAENDGAGIVGVAPATKLHAVKVLDNRGSGSFSQVICGIDWVTANADRLKIKVANMSLSGLAPDDDGNCGRTDGKEDPFHQAVCRATEAGILQVVAAGNEGWDMGDSPPNVPASYPEALTVTAMSDSDGQDGANGADQSCETVTSTLIGWALSSPILRGEPERVTAPGESDDAYASFSNYASREDDIAHMVAGPGVCIHSTWPGNNYVTLSGTSMASPHVAGVVALCLGEGGARGPCSGKTPAQIIDHVRGEAAEHSAENAGYGFAGDPLRPNKFGDYFGYLVRAPQDTLETSIVTGPSGVSSATRAEFSFISTEAGASFECRLDGPGETSGSYASCTSPKAYSNLADGSYTFSVKAKDAAGNEDETPATRSFTVDTTPPQIAITAPADGARYVEGERVEADYACSDSASGIKSCEGPVAKGQPVDTASAGAKSFRVSAEDNAGNSVAKTVTYTVEPRDTTPPQIAITAPADGARYVEGERVEADYACSDSASGIKSCEGPVAKGQPVDTASAGAKSFRVSAEDNAGNNVAKTVTYTVESRRASGGGGGHGATTGTTAGGGASSGTIGQGGVLGVRRRGGCLGFQAGTSGKRLGAARLGRKRGPQRHALKDAKPSARGSVDRYCIAGGGTLRIVYARGRAAAIVTTSRRYSLAGIRPGDGTGTLRRRLPRARSVRIGQSMWYLGSRHGGRVVFKTHGGRVLEAGIADSRLMRSSRGAKGLLRAF